MKEPTIQRNPTTPPLVRAISELLDDRADARFDRVTRLAQQTFGVSMAVISFIHQAKLLFKSYQGIDLPTLPLDQTFCGHADRKSVV